MPSHHRIPTRPLTALFISHAESIDRPAKLWEVLDQRSMSIQVVASTGIIASMQLPPVTDFLSSDTILPLEWTHTLDTVHCLRNWALELPFLHTEGICTQLSRITSCRLWDKATACLPCTLVSAQKAPTLFTLPLLNSLSVMATKGLLEETVFLTTNYILPSEILVTISHSINYHPDCCPCYSVGPADHIDNNATYSARDVWVQNSI